MHTLLRLALLSLTLCLAAAAQADDAVTASDAWIREAPPGAPMLAGYLVLTNHSGTERALVKAEGADFGAIELHRSVFEDGMARMMPQERIPVPAGGAVELKPGDYHLMLMRPARPLRAGDVSEITLHFDDGSRLPVRAEVRRAGIDGAQPHGHDHGHDNGHTHH
ncbi:MAG: copper chaperone PCu(A)C [Gammaproteobacteria bacterium]|nr:copper chaperone PCu(A)C [Chromatiales bacterium]MDX5333338.1 copper chaperone PCu(A)C [Gammaproteobacteria bacterium]MDX5374976.1 copper chaperone PCu(A)C [Gammaproteobacteria bacterium]